MALRIVEFLICWLFFFKTFRIFSKTTMHRGASRVWKILTKKLHFENLKEDRKMGCGRLICLCDYAHFFLTPKVMAFVKVKILIFDLFCKFFISRKLPSQFSDYGFNQNFRLHESLLHRLLPPIFSHKNLCFS